MSLRKVHRLFELYETGLPAATVGLLAALFRQQKQDTGIRLATGH